MEDFRMNACASSLGPGRFVQSVFRAVLVAALIVCGWTASSGHAEKPKLDPANSELRRDMVNARDMPLYTLHMGSELQSTWLFGLNDSPPIPAGFFGAGSDPWSGGISCVGIPIDPNGPAPTSDLMVRHEAIEWIPNPEARYGPREIPRSFKLRCQMVKLHEKVVEPITVTFDDGARSEKWGVEVTLAKEHPGGGMIEITRLNADGNGGLADIEIAVKVDFIFRRVGDDKELTLTSPIEWLSETNHEWSRWADPLAMKAFNIPEAANGNFIPASRTVGGHFEAKGCNSKNARVQHSFTIAPSVETLQGSKAGTLSLLKQFEPRRN